MADQITETGEVKVEQTNHSRWDFLKTIGDKFKKQPAQVESKVAPPAIPVESGLGKFVTTLKENAKVSQGPGAMASTEGDEKRLWSELVANEITTLFSDLHRLVGSFPHDKQEALYQSLLSGDGSTLRVLAERLDSEIRAKLKQPNINMANQSRQERSALKLKSQLANQLIRHLSPRTKPAKIENIRDLRSRSQENKTAAG